MLTNFASLGHVNNNRFLLVNLLDNPTSGYEAELLALSQCLCHSRLIDDLLVLDASDVADAKYRIFGGDGREADFCCNGALFSLSTLGRGGRTGVISFETRIGPRKGIIDDAGQRFELGPIETTEFQPIDGTESLLRESRISILGMRRAGEPHVVVSAPPFLQGSRFDREEFERLSAKLCDGFLVEGGVNVTMVFTMERKDEVTIRTYERGARRMTDSCGSGAMAAASVVFAATDGDGELKIHSPGGTHRVWHVDGSWWVSAPAHQESFMPLGMFLEYVHGKRNRWSQTLLPFTSRPAHHDEIPVPQKEVVDSHRT